MAAKRHNRFVRTKHILTLVLATTLAACGGGGGSTTNTTQPPPPSNNVPTVNAGIDITAEERSVITLQGTATDSDGTIARYQWTQDVGSTVVLSDENSATPSFTAPSLSADEQLEFTLTVTDNSGATASDTVAIVLKDVLFIDEISLQDSALTQCVNQITSGNNWQKVEQVTALSCNEQNIASLSGLDAFTKLSTVAFNNNQITNIASLEPLTAINRLSLANNQIEDISAVSSMLSMTQLDLSDNHISDISALSTLTALKVLSLTNNQITDVTPLLQLNELTDVSVGSNESLSCVEIEALILELGEDVVTRPEECLEQNAPTVNAGENQSVNENTQVTLTATAQDSDGSIVSYQWQQTAGITVTTAASDQPTLQFNAPDVGSDQTLAFQLTVTDNKGLTATDSVEVNVLQVIIAPQVSAGSDQTVNELTTVTLTANASDSDGLIMHYQWQQLSGSTVTLSDSNVATPSFNTPNVSSDEILTFSVTVTDNDGITATDNVTVNVKQVINVPTADAGVDQTVDERTTVTLAGSGSDSDGTIASYLWRQLSGTSVTLSDSDQATASFEAPDVNSDEILTFELLTTDDDGTTATDTVSININQVIIAPIAKAGSEQKVDEQTTVTLSGSATDADGTVDSYLWQQLSGTKVTLSNSAAATTTFNAPDINADETLTFELTVTDNDGAQGAAQVAINVNKVNQAPVINAGEDQAVNYNDAVTLQAVASDPDGEIVSYQWRQTSGSTVNMSQPDSDLNLFVAPLSDNDETLTFELTVTDNDGATAVDAVNIAVTAPIQIANVALRDDNLKACIDSTASANNWSYAFQLETLACPNNNIHTLSGIEVFSALRELVVNDNQIDDTAFLANLAELSILNLDNNRLKSVGSLSKLSNAKTISIQGNEQIPCEDITALIGALENTSISWPKHCEVAPQVNAGHDQYMFENTEVTLFGQATDNDGHIVSYRWQQTAGPSVSITKQDQPIASIIAPVSLQQYSLTFEFTAIDNHGLSATDTVTVYISPDKATSQFSFADENMQLCYDVLLQHNNYQKLSEIKKFDCQIEQVASIDGIEAFKALQWLDLMGNPSLSDIGPLQKLTSLKHLYLRGTGVEDISPVANLQQLSTLELGLFFAPWGVVFVTPVSDLTPLAQLHNLSTLKLSAIPASDISPLSSLSQLTILDLSYLKLDSYKPIQALVQLQTLDLSYNNLGDLAVLEPLQLLQKLVLAENPIGNLNSLSKLTRLTDLEMRLLSIKDLSPLSQLISLKHLDIMQVDSDDLTPLENLSNLETIELYSLPVHSLKPLFKLNKLTKLTLTYLPQASCADINQLKRQYGDIVNSYSTCVMTTDFLLSDLVLDDANLQQCIEDAAQNTGVTTIGELNWLDCSARNIEDLNGIDQLIGLKELNLSDNDFIYFEVLESLTWLDKLVLEQNEQLVCYQLNLLDQQLNDTQVVMGDSCYEPPLISDVNIPDVNLRACIDEYANSSGLYWVNQLKQMDCSSKRIQSLQGLDEVMPWVTWLRLSNNLLEDINPIHELKYLKVLTINNNQITDISPLNGLSKLSSVEMNNNKITDITPLNGLSELTSVEIINNKVNSMTSLDNMGKLQKLDLSYNQITQPIAPDVQLSLPVLTRLNLDHNKISDPSSLSNGHFPLLTTLILSNNTMLTLGGFEQMPQLQYLRINDNEIENIDALLPLQKLVSLSADSNKITEISTLAEMASLKFATVSRNAISKPFGGIATDLQFSALKSLDLSYNQLEDTSAFGLADFPDLTKLSLGNNQLTRISRFERMPKIQQLRLQSNLLTDIEPLRDMTTISFLNLQNNNQMDCLKMNSVLATLTNATMVMSPLHCLQ